MPLKLEDVDAFVELGDSLLFGLKLIDEQFATVEQNVLRLVLRGLGSFQRLEGDKSKANEAV